MSGFDHFFRGPRRRSARRAASLPLRLSRALLRAGAWRVGYADLSGVAERPLKHLRVGVSVLLPFAGLGLAGRPGTPSADPAYIQAYMDSRDRVDPPVALGAALLRAAGYEAWGYGYHQHPNWPEGDLNPEARLSAYYQHKTTARLAGLGWIGRMGVLVTRQYGPHVWLGTIFTNAPLPTARPTERSECGSCRRCQAACPVEAVQGGLWRPGMARAELLDVEKCQPHRRERGRGLAAPMCGLCLAACPYGFKIIKKSGGQFGSRPE